MLHTSHVLIAPRAESFDVYSFKGDRGIGHDLKQHLEVIDFEIVCLSLNANP